MYSDNDLPAGIPGIRFRLALARERLRSKRGGRKVTQSEIAAAVGVSDGLVGHWETGVQVPDLAMIERLARVLEVSEAWLFPGTGPIGPQRPPESDAEFEARTGVAPRARAPQLRVAESPSAYALEQIAAEEERPASELIGKKKPAKKASRKKRAG